jgi:hypothetical protein
MSSYAEPNVHHAISFVFVVGYIWVDMAARQTTTVYTNVRSVRSSAVYRTFAVLS